jgi:hypothetical protein
MRRGQLSKGANKMRRGQLSKGANKMRRGQLSKGANKMRRGQLRKAATEKRRFKNVMVTYRTPLRVELTDEIIEAVIARLKVKEGLRSLSVVNIDKKLTREISGSVSIVGVALERDGTETEFVAKWKGGKIVYCEIDTLSEEEELTPEAQEFVDEFGEETAKEILDSFGFEFDDIDDFRSDGDSYELEIGSQSWLGFKDFSDAETYAENYVRDMLESEFELFNQDWLMGHVDSSAAERFFTQVYNEWNYSYAMDINSESSSQFYDSRLTDELIERGIVDEDDVLDEEGEIKEDWDPEDHIDEFVEKMTEDQIDEGQGGYAYYEFNFGEEEARKLLREQNLIDIDSATSEAVRIDGVAHSLSTYDGNEYEVDGTYWYRQ